MAGIACQIGLQGMEQSRKADGHDQPLQGNPYYDTIKYARVSAGKPGSHAVSGGWQTTEVDVSNHAEDTTFKVSGGALSMIDRMGRSFTTRMATFKSRTVIG